MKHRTPVYVKESFYDPDYLPPEIAATGPPPPEMAGAELVGDDDDDVDDVDGDDTDDEEDEEDDQE